MTNGLLLLPSVFLLLATFTPPTFLCPADSCSDLQLLSSASLFRAAAAAAQTITSSKLIGYHYQPPWTLCVFIEFGLQKLLFHYESTLKDFNKHLESNCCSQAAEVIYSFCCYTVLLQVWFLFSKDLSVFTVQSGCIFTFDSLSFKLSVVTLDFIFHWISSNWR